MSEFYVLLAVAILVGIAQIALAGRLSDLIHGGASRRGPRGRAADVLILRAAGAFVIVIGLVGVLGAFLAGG